MGVERFSRFGGEHLGALLIVVALSVGAVMAGRRHGASVRLARGIAWALLAAGIGYVIVDAIVGKPWSEIAPFHLCDAAVFIGAWALHRRDQLAYELTLLWGLAGTTPAMLWPDLAEGFPHFRFFFYFAQHGLIVVAAMYMTFGMGMRPRGRAPVYAWLALNAYALVVGVVNVLAETNFLYLREPPGSGSPLDLFGPWPWYILGGELIAITAFTLLVLPFVLSDRPWRRTEARPPPGARGSPAGGDVRRRRGR